MSLDCTSNPTASEPCSSSVSSSRVSSPSVIVMSDPSIPTTSRIASSSSASFVPSTNASESPSPSIDGTLPQSPPFLANDARFTNGEPSNIATTSQSQTPDVDAQILEALKSKDRLYVLKLGEIMEELINEKRIRADLTPTTSYQRMLVHRCSAYYKLQPESDPITKAISVVLIAESRVPSRRLAELVPLEPAAQPAFKIMRRTPQDRRTKTQSHAGSVTGEDADSSDIEPSEAGSLGGRSNATGGSNKKRMTIEEREAAYKEARSRIFMGFEEKEKERDMSATSSSLSLASSSASTSGGGGSSSAGEPDDSASSLATDGEWTAASFNRKDSRRSNASASSSSRSLRGSAAPFTSNGSGSSRNSRAPSPSFTYASLYEPAPAGPSYDPQLGNHHPAPGYQAPPYMYTYPPPTQPNPPYINPYPYYPPYPYGHPPVQPPQNASDSSTSTSAEMYAPPPHMMYPYMWQTPSQPPIHSAPPMQTQNSSNQVAGPPPPAALQYPPYVSPTYGYPMHSYFPPPPAQHPRSAPLHTGGQLYEEPRMMNGPGGGPSHPNNNSPRGVNGNANWGINNRNGRNGSGPSNGGKPRNVPRQAWSFGPGVGMGGVPMTGNNIPSGSSSNGEVVGPRLSSTMRRPSNTSTGSSSGNYRPPSTSDDVASTASSSTSSSSRRTYTSTASSQHPLPPRPDWAVGLKPDPTLHATNRHHDHTSRNISPISPPRALSNGASHSNPPSRRPPHQLSPPISLQSTDFPPLTSIASPEKRTPTVGGAWNNTSSTRSLLMTPPNPGPTGPTGLQGSALIHPSNAQNAMATNHAMFDDGFERPPPKGTELYNPKVVKRPTNINGRSGNEPGDKAGADGVLTEQMSAFSLVDVALRSPAQLSKDSGSALSS